MISRLLRDNEINKLEDIKVDSDKRPKMTISNRAKQFAPFDALKGFREALKEKEKIKIDKKELSEERAKEINELLKNVKEGMLTTIVYYLDGEYIQLTGIVLKIEKQKRCLQIEETVICFDDIYDIIN